MLIRRLADEARIEGRAGGGTQVSMTLPARTVAEPARQLGWPQDGMSVEREHLRVLVANEREDRIGLVASIVQSLGHTVIARSINVGDVGALTASEHPDVALVGLGHSSEHALELIDLIVREASCPVIALLEGRDAAFVQEAARRGVFAYLVDGDPEALQSALDITLRRFSEYHNLQGAFGRRAVTERAKRASSWNATRSTSSARSSSCGSTPGGRTAS